MFYNFDYGFIEGTRADDGDHTDALLIIDEPTFTGCHVWARPIGGLEMRDEKGFDFKTLCVALGDPHQQHIERLDQVRPHRLVEIEHFFRHVQAARGEGRSTSSAGATRTAPARSCSRTASAAAREQGALRPTRRLFVAVPRPAGGARRRAAP